MYLKASNPPLPMEDQGLPSATVFSTPSALKVCHYSPMFYAHLDMSCKYYNRDISINTLRNWNIHVYN